MSLLCHRCRIHLKFVELLLESGKPYQIELFVSASSRKWHSRRRNSTCLEDFDWFSLNHPFGTSTSQQTWMHCSTSIMKMFDLFLMPGLKKQFNLRWRICNRRSIYFQRSKSSNLQTDGNSKSASSWNIANGVVQLVLARAGQCYYEQWIRYSFGMASAAIWGVVWNNWSSTH